MDIEEVKRLKEIIKQKNVKLKSANSLIKRLKEGRRANDVYEHFQCYQNRLLENMTRHLEEHMYEVDFVYNDQTIRKRKVKSFNSRNLDIAIILDICRVEKIVVGTYEIDILNATKLW